MCAEKTEERSWMTDEEAMGEGGGLEWETKVSRLITELIMIFESGGGLLRSFRRLVNARMPLLGV